MYLWYILGRPPCTVQLQCEKDVGMGLCQYVDLCFHALSLPCLHTFWHAIPTSFYIFNVFFKSCYKYEYSCPIKYFPVNGTVVFVWMASGVCSGAR